MSDSSADVFREFYRHHWALNPGDTPEKETAEFWDKRSEMFAAQAHSMQSRQESLDFLRRFAWHNDERVLDVAAGPGTFAVPLAKMVKEVVATDFSAGMLKHLRQQAAVEKVENIRSIEGRWLDIAEPGVYDTVLCLNSLGVIATAENHQPQLDKALLKLRDCCAKRLIMLIPHADSPLNLQMRKILGLDEVPVERRRVAVLYYAMVDCGMLPDLAILKRSSRWSFADIAEARSTLLKKAGIEAALLDEKKGAGFDEYLQKSLHRGENGQLSLPYEISQALYVWERKE